MIRLNAVLAAILVVCALALVTSQHKARKLSVFDFEQPGSILLLLQFDEQLSRLVLRGDQRQCADHQNSGQHRIEPDHGAALSATRITALRARGFAVTSSSVG